MARAPSTTCMLTGTRHTDRVFSHALATVRRLPRTGSSRPPPSARLRLYGLYKQSMEGDVDAILPRPTLPPPSPPLSQQQPHATDAHDQTTATMMAQQDASKNGGSALMRYGSRQLRTREAQAEIEKWDAWHACKGMSRTAAKKAYIRTLIETMKEYASGTQESRELVGELEFVWRQSEADYEGGGGSVVANEEVIDGSESASAPSSSPRRAHRMVSTRNNNNNNDLTGVEAHLRHLSTEIAALREQLSSRYLLAPSGYSPYVYQHLSFRWRLWYKMLALVRWAMWMAVRQALIQLSLLGLVVVYGRWKGDRRLETWLRHRVKVALSWGRRGWGWRWVNRVPFG
ncbi:hypothetical protein DV736_g5380, partial [Chaetothyriales sp. CBS 134916]